MTRALTTLCQVCGEKVSHGNHFGVHSCRACAAFFRRTVHSRWSKLNCQGGSCDQKTFFCKPCRLQRCFERGMETSNFQYNRDGIVCSTVSLPPTVDLFIGKPNFIFINSPISSKTLIDVYRLIGEGSKILNLGPSSPIHCGSSQLKKLSLGLEATRFGKKKLKYAKNMTKTEVSANWEFYFKNVAKWLVHFDEYKKLDIKVQMTLLKTVWHVWSRLEKLYATSKYRKSESSAQKYEIVVQGNVVVDIQNVGFDSSWLSDLPTPQLRNFMIHTSCDQFDVTQGLCELDPSEVEISYMLAQLSFQYAAKRHSGDIEIVCERMLEVLADDLHNYYVEEMKMPNYSRRMAKMMRINNQIQRNIREGHERMQVIKLFNIFKVDFTHPEMFQDSGFN